MRTGLLFFHLLLATLLFGQTTNRPLPEFQLDSQVLKAQLYFLASDFLAGRHTTGPGIEIAAHYIAAQLKAYGFESPEGADNYFQTFELESSRLPESAALRIGGATYDIGKDLLLLSGKAGEISAPLIFAGHGWIDEESDHNDYKDLDVKGKIVLTLPGQPGKTSPGSIFNAAAKKRQLAAERGAVALIELHRMAYPNWDMFRSYLGGDVLQPRSNAAGADENFAYGWLKEQEPIDELLRKSKKPITAQLTSSGQQRRVIPARNVIGVLPGTDPELRDEYVLLSAHYDHVGVGRQGGPYSPEDSIFNGARDNGFGTLALLSAARSLSEQRPKRSVIILAVTGEEVGFLGSKYYADHPLIPLEKTIFNLNNDGAGYNSTEHVTIIGWGRTGTNDLITAGAKPFGLTALDDPAPEQGLFDRSDNVSFAVKGIPAANFAPGMTGFDEAIAKYYHRPEDEPESVNYTYLLKYCQAFAHTARQIANSPTRPAWVAGDKYEAAGKKLYGN